MVSKTILSFIRCSPQMLDPRDGDPHYSPELLECEIKHLKQNKQKVLDYNRSSSENLKARNEIIVEESNSMEFQKIKSDITKCTCECVNAACTNCLGTGERIVYNNLNSNINNNMVNTSPNMLSVARASRGGKLKYQSSSQSSIDGSCITSPSLSRGENIEVCYFSFLIF